MLDVIKVASYIFERYKAQEKTIIDEMKLHKLLYFTQRECIAQTLKNEAWGEKPQRVSRRAGDAMIWLQNHLATRSDG